MSLETAILENTSVLRELIARLSAGASPTAVTMTAAEYVAAIDKPAAAPVTEVKAAPKAKTAEVVKSPELDAAVEKVEATAKEVTYDEVKALVLLVSKDKGREAAAAVLNGLGVAKAPELKAEQYAAAVKQLTAALAA